METSCYISNTESYCSIIVDIFDINKSKRNEKRILRSFKTIWDIDTYHWKSDNHFVVEGCEMLMPDHDNLSILRCIVDNIRDNVGNCMVRIEHIYRPVEEHMLYDFYIAG
jgi:hypothetical protein